MDMKIINNTDINNLIVYAKKNLGIYKLVYKKVNKIYFFSIILLLVSLLLLTTTIFFIYFNISILYEKMCGFCCLLSCLCTLLLLRYVDDKTKRAHLKIQKTRYKLLKKYYNSKNYNIDHIKIINQQLKKRINKIEKQKVTILVVISVMALPIWDVFVQLYFKNFSFTKIVKFFVFLIFFSGIILVAIRFFNKTLYLYEENFYIKNNIALIENLIYLNEYIIKEKEGHTHNGRRR